MPPRYAYWTILVDDQPTAFRSGSQEELMPTFNRLKQKHASAKMMWWQNGKLWESRLDAQEAMRARGEIGRRSDPRQEERGGRPFKPTGSRYSDRAPRASERRAERAPSGKLDWKPRGEHDGAPREHRAKKPVWIPKSQAPSPKSHEKPEWKPKGSFTPERQKFAAEGRESRRSAKREGGPEWKPKGSFKPERSARPEWSPKSQAPYPKSPEKRKWVPKAEYKRSQAPSPKSQAPRDKNWRPGGEHKDPRQKYKDAKKAKWDRFKQTVRKRSEAKGKTNDK